MNKPKEITGWNTLWPWVIVAFLVVIAAWIFLIKKASENALEPIPIERSSDDAG